MHSDPSQERDPDPKPVIPPANGGELTILLRQIRDRLPPPAASAQGITTIELTFVGAAVFCILSLLTPDSALLTAGAPLNVPFAGPVSFRGFLLVGPAVLIALRIYLQIHAEHSRELGNPLLRVFTWVVLYLLLPGVMLLFTWKAAVFPAWGAGLLCVTVAVIVGHALLPLCLSWWVKALLSVGAAVLAFAATAYGHWPISQGPIHRPFDLFRAELSNQWLVGRDLRGANLARANLAGTAFGGADLAGANLERAKLAGTDLAFADLAGADLRSADLAGANLDGASLAGANLDGAVLAGATLWEANLADALLSGVRFAGEEGPARTLTQAQIEAGPARRLTQLQIDVAWAWADFPPVGLDRLHPPLILPKSHLCDKALRPAWSEAVQASQRGYGRPAGCSGAAGARAAAQ
jgi:Pentapeptide repeats (8 copies)